MKFRLVDALLLLLILATAAGARVGYLVTYAADATTEGPVQFQVQDPSPLLPLAGEPNRTEREVLVQNLREHHWFGSLAPFAGTEERTAHTSPGYPWLLGELARLPMDADSFGPVVRWIQCALGTLTAAFYFLFAHRAFRNRTVAFLGGLFCALHPFWIVSTAELADGVVASFLLGGCIWLGNRGGQVGGALTSLLFGLGLAALALVRAALLPFGVVALLWFLLRCRKLPQGALASLLAFLGFLTGLAPWMLRNYEVYHDVFPIVDSTYLHLWMGNNSRATGGPQKERDALEALVGTSNPAETAERLAGLGQGRRYDSLAEAVVEEVRRDPVAVLQRRLWAGLCFFFGEDNLRQWARTPSGAESKSEESELAANSSYRALLTASLLGMLVFAAIGWRWTYGWAAEAMPSSLAVFWIPLPYLLSHAEARSGPRLPLDGVLLCYAAFAVVCLLPRLGSKLLRESAPEVDAD